jgi:glycosyltransferase involved in cell wall biosynthesis
MLRACKAAECSLAAVKIALVAPPVLPVPPAKYGGVERIVGVLADGLRARGHDVTLFAPGDSTFAGELVATVPSGLWNNGFHPDPSAHYVRTTEMVLERAREFEVIHSHLDQYGLDLSRSAPVPVVGTMHGRTDIDPLAGAIRAHLDAPLVAISARQRSFVPEANWVATILHGLDFSGVPEGRGGQDLVFVGRLSREKGIANVVEVARLAGRRLHVAAKALDPYEREMYETVIKPAVEEGVVDFLGELGATDRDRLLGESLATVMLSRWEEPFGLVAIESLAAGTPVIASPNGALPEIVEDGVDGYVVDSPAAGAAAVARVGQLDRARIRRRAFARFSAARMLDDYEKVYAQLASQRLPSCPR